ncbi:MAG TPA: asparagine synthase (glutamine-hydrolyzing), partial [Stellaceae bacterium]|nr:asparagine synthase (glutamine-hydrolyzing) [Stellaceae bacterium]
GPNGRGVFVDAGIALGHTRLAIIDPTGGAQPRVDEESGDALIFNGEIYGYRALADELRAAGVALRDRSDTEVLFHLIRRDGLRNALSRIDGMFAFAFRDGATGAVHLIRDRLGEKPLYYGLARNALVFASEVGALLCHPGFRGVAPDRLAAYAFLLFEYLPGNRSGWTGIEKLEPGTILTFRNGRVSRERYWAPGSRAAGNAAGDESEAVDRLDALLRDSVKRRIVADVPVGVFLSGGLDSGLITAFAAQAAPDLTAFTVRVGGKGGFDETAHATTVARHLGVRHEIVELDAADLGDAFAAISGRLSEPLGDSSLLPTYLVCRAARRLMTVALGGDGADELFAGYPNFAVQRFAPAMRRIPAAAGRLFGRAVEALPVADGYMNARFVLRQLSQGFGATTARQSFLWMAPFGPGEIDRLWRRSALPEQALAAAFAPIDRHAAEAEGGSAIEKLLHLFLVTYLPEDILTKTDRASMFNSLEVRAPFLDRTLVEYAYALPTDYKLRAWKRKYVLKRLAYRYLPRAIVDRKKHGFAVPIGALIRGGFWERCRDVLLSRDNPVADWFERAAIEALLDEHRGGRHDHGKKLWALYILFCVAGRNVGASATDAARGLAAQ